jgi:hypothetical protein
MSDIAWRPCCSHSIVRHDTVSSARYPGEVTDTWVCCDCGLRFAPALHLPTYMPEPSHLHVKLQEANAKIERLTEDRAYWSHLCERHSIALALIATPPRPDGTWNRDRQACYELAKQELERTP